MRLTVAIATYNRREALEKTLRALDDQTLTRVPWDVVVWNNGSTDGTRHVINRLRTMVGYRIGGCNSPNRRGPGEAMSAAIKSASGEIVVSLGDDMVPTPTYLEEVLRFHEERPDPNVVVLARAIWHPDLPRTPLMDYVETHGNQFDYGGITDPENATYKHAYITNLSFKRELLDQQPLLLDPALSGAYDDIELGYRLEQQGVRFAYNEQAVSQHYDCKTLGSFLWRTYLAGRNDPVFAQKHPELDGTLLAAKNVARQRWDRATEAEIGAAIATWDEAATVTDERIQQAIGTFYVAGVVAGIARSGYTAPD